VRNVYADLERTAAVLAARVQVIGEKLIMSSIQSVKTEETSAQRLSGLGGPVREL
jgi:hypothetical protein